MISSRHNIKQFMLRPTRKLEAPTHNTDCNVQRLSDSLDLEIDTRGLGGHQPVLRTFKCGILAAPGTLPACHLLNGPATEYTGAFAARSPSSPRRPPLAPRWSGSVLPPPRSGLLSTPNRLVSHRWLNTAESAGRPL